jgi:uncharacterized damage-inducible protein DinB
MRVSVVQPDEYAGFYEGYIKQVTNEFTLQEELEISVHRFIKFVQNLPMDRFDYRYAEGKWTIKDIIQHLIDAERVFAYRALRFARRDQTPLPGFEEDDYVMAAQGNKRGLQDLLTEFLIVRQSTMALFKTFDQETLMQAGTASGRLMSVRALGFVIIGHQNHHMRVFEERYL